MRHVSTLAAIVGLIACNTAAAQIGPLDEDAIYNPYTGAFAGGDPKRIAVDDQNRPVLFGDKFATLPTDWRSIYLRALPNGDPDSTFDAESFVFHNVCTSIELARGVECIGEKFYGMGQEDFGGFDNDGIFVQRLNADGSPDTTFWDDGKFIFQFNAEYTQARAMDRTPDGGVVIAGLNNDYNTFLVKLQADGSFDSSFGGAGVVDAGLIGQWQDDPADVCVLADGSMIVMGWYRPILNANRGLYVMKVLPDGTLDAAFGTDGVALMQNDTEEWIPQRMAAAPDGGAYIATHFLDASGNDRLLVQHVLPSGDFDTSFGNGGRVIFPTVPGWEYPYPRGIGVLPEGWVVVTTSTSTVMLACLLPNGEFVNGFGNGGIMNEEYFGSQLTNKDLAVDLDGNVWVIGAANNLPVAYRILIDISVGLLDAADAEEHPVLLGGPVIGDALTLEWSLSEPSDMRAQLLSTDGRDLGMLWQGHCLPGRTQHIFDLPTGLAEGAYLLRLTSARSGTAVRFVKH